MTSSVVRSALITGSSDVQGLGFAAAHLLASKYGFNVILTGRKQTSLDAAVKVLKDRLGDDSTKHVHSLVLDVTCKESVQNAVASLSTAEGLLSVSNGALDVLINNAGLGAPPGRGGKGTQTMFLPVNETTTDDMQVVFQSNVFAVVDVVNAFIPLLARSQAPRIVNVSSQRASMTFASGLPAERTGAMVYNASKAALNMVTVMQSKNLPSLVKPNLLVNAASPGHVSTPFNNFTGHRSVEEGAAVYAHLATLPDSGPTGQLIANHPPWSADGSYVSVPF